MNPSPSHVRATAQQQKPETLRGAVPLSHYYLRQRVGVGDLAVDATCGNGQDTLLLAELVGEGGRVWAFDLQSRAIEATRELLQRHGRLESVELVQAGHERLAEVVSAGVVTAGGMDTGAAAGLAVVVFNLGYLPGGEEALVTAPESTVAALEQAADLLKPGGIVTICLYTGHAGGPEEAQAVEAWGAALDPRRFNVWRSRQLNRAEVAPYLVLVEKIR